MNKYFAMFAFAASSLLIAACSNSDSDDVINNESKEMSFLVGAPSSNTRAVVSGIETQTPSVNWEETDQIFVWGEGETNSHTFTFQKYGNYHNYAAFTGTAFTASKYYIMYPKQDGAKFDGNGNITATIPAIQKATQNSFDPNAAICAGATAGQNERTVSILHACAFLKITTTKDCKSISVSAHDKNVDGAEWKVAGEVTIQASSTGAKITGYNDAVETVKLTADGTESASTTFSPGTYLIAIITSTKFPGIDVTVDYSDGTKAEKSSSSTFQFNAANIYNLGTATPNTGV